MKRETAVAYVGLEYIDYHKTCWYGWFHVLVIDNFCKNE